MPNERKDLEEHLKEELTNILGVPEEEKSTSETPEKLSSIEIETPPMTEDDIVKFVVDCYKKSQENRLNKEVQWLDAIQQYNLIHDYTHKADWQAKIVLPKIFDAVEHIVTFIENGLLGLPEFYRVEGIKNSTISSIIKEILDLHLDYKFFVELSQAIRYSLLTSYGVLKIRHTYEQIPIAVSSISSFDVFLDPTLNNKFIIHRSIKPWDDLYIAQMQGANYYNLDLAKERTFRTYEEIKEKIARGEASEVDLPNLKEVHLLEFWGTIYNDKGEAVYRNVVCTVANEHTLIRAPESFENFFPDKPFIVFYAIPPMNTNYPPAFVANLCNIAKYLNEIASLFFDAAAYASMPLFRINPHLIMNMDELLEGISPGTVIEGLENAIEVLRISPGITQDLLAMFSLLKTEFTETSGVTEFLTGRPTTKGRPTAKEVMLKRAQGAMFFNKFARAVEFQLLEPLIFGLYNTIRKYVYYNDTDVYDEITSKYGFKLSTLPPEERLKYLPEDVKFKVYGLSLITSQNEKLEKLLAFMNVVSKIAPLQEVLDMRKVVKKFAELLGIYPLDIFSEKVIKSFIEEETMEGEYGEKEITRLG